MNRSFLLIGLACLIAGVLIACGVISAAHKPVLHVVLPLGAVFVGLYLVARVIELEREPTPVEPEGNPPANHGHSGGH